ncbi:MAG: hemin-binding protein [Herbaspirillum sp.]|nr:hemin-binding protein [Herbaspirillum sp.]
MKRSRFSHALGGMVGVSLLLAIGFPLAAHAQQDDDRFNIERFQVDGNTLLPAERVRRLMAPLSGPDRAYGDIQKALELLESAYREAGYTAVQVYVPEQELTGGIVRINVVESVLGHVEVHGNQYFDNGNILDGLRPLKVGEPPNLRDISSAVQLVNDNAAKQVAVTMSVSPIPGQIDAKIDVTDSKPRRIFTTLDNTGTAATGKWRTGMAWQENNLWNRDQVATLAYTTSPDSPSGVSVNLFSLGYRIPLYAYGDSLDFIYGKSTVNTPASSPTLGSALGFVGKGDIYGARWNHYLPRMGESSAKIVFGIDYKKIDSSCTFGGVDINTLAPTGPCTPYITRPVSVTYIGQRQSPGAALDYNIGLARNLALGARHQNTDPVTGANTDFDRYSFLTPGNRGTRDDFTVVRGGASLLKALSGDWQVRLAGTLQYAPDPLVSSEQLGLVGAAAVRGFDEREVASDSGLVANAELYTPELAARTHMAGHLRLLGFYDLGRGYNSHLGASLIPAMVTVASTGIGIRYGAGKDFNVRADVARVLNPGTANAQRGDWRAHISAILGF